MINISVKNCFCGSEATFMEKRAVSFDGEAFKITCANCGYCTPPCKSNKHAIAVWNDMQITLAKHYEVLDVNDQS